MARLVIVLGLLLTLRSVQGQISIVQPIGTPTTNDVLVAHIQFIQNGSCLVTPTTVLNGNLIRTDVAVSNCTPLLPFLAGTSTGFGPLAGTYTWEARVSYDGGPPQFIGSTTVVVLEAPAIPLLDTTTLVILAMALAAIAISALRESRVSM